jgi:mono/diheme cytochrome c family protein
MMRRRRVSKPVGISLRLTTWIAAGTAIACSGGSGGASGASEPEALPQFQIVTASGGPLEAVAGDALLLKVVELLPDGSTGDLPTGANVVWTSPSPITSLPPNSGAPSPMPVLGAQPSAAWIDNPSRPDQSADLANVLFVLDPGTVQNAVVQVSAAVSGVSTSGGVTASVTVDPIPAGDWTRGGSLYGPSGANCALCHGASGHGSPADPDGSTYTLGGTSYPFPAPGLNAEPGNTASDPAWNAALFAVASRADLDNGGISLRLPMPDWLTRSGPTGPPLTTQDFADIFAFLKTQTH